MSANKTHLIKEDEKGRTEEFTEVFGNGSKTKQSFFTPLMSESSQLLNDMVPPGPPNAYELLSPQERIPYDIFNDERYANEKERIALGMTRSEWQDMMNSDAPTMADNTSDTISLLDNNNLARYFEDSTENPNGVMIDTQSAQDQSRVPYQKVGDYKTGIKRSLFDNNLVPNEETGNYELMPKETNREANIRGKAPIVSEPVNTNNEELNNQRQQTLDLTTEDIAIIDASPTGQSMAQEFGNDLAAANGDPAKIDAAKAEFGDGLFDLAEYDPQLAKSLFAMMGAMLMGESFGDAMATGFGVMEEAAMEEEATNKAAADEVVALLIDNAEYLSDDVFFATLAQYNLSDEQLKDITMKYGIAKSAAQNKKTATNLAQALTDLNKFEKDTIALYTDSDNVGAVAPKIRQLLTYVHDQLDKQAKPTWLLDPKNRENRDALEEAIGTYAKRYDQYTAMGEDGIGLLKTLEAGGMEAIWEGQRGTVGMVDGKPAMGKVLIPQNQEPLMMAITAIANVKMKDEEKRNQYLAEKHDYWKKNIEGKKGMAYNEDYDSVVATGYLSKPEEYGYLGWLYHQLQADTM